MNTTFFAAFEDADHADKAVGALLDHGIPAASLSLVANRSYDELQHERYVAEGGQVRSLDDATFDEVTATGYGGNVIREQGLPTSRGEGALNTQYGIGYGTEMAGGIPSTDGLTAYPHGNVPIDDDAGAPSVQRMNEERDDRESVPRTAGYEAATSEIEDPIEHARKGITTTTPEDAGRGAITGAAVGLGVGVLAGLAALFIPGVGLVMGAGALATAMAGTAASAGAGAIAGGVFGYLKDQGVPDEELTVYRDVFHRGGAILSITVPNGFNRAELEGICAKYGAINIDAYGDVRA